MKTSLSPSARSGYTFIEIILVLGIITIIMGSVVVMMGGAVNNAAVQRVDADLMNIESALKLYEMNNKTLPSTAQGLEALVNRPTSEPKPRRWTQIMTDIPKDPWNNPYVYVNPGKKNAGSYDLYSMGVDKQDGTEDDLYLEK